MRSGALRMAVIAAAAVLPAAAAAQTQENNKAVHAFISAVDLGEVQSSVLAHERAASAEVRQFAMMMIADHSNALHGREARLQQQNQGLMTGRMSMEEFRAAGQGPLPPSYGPGNGGNASGGNVPEGQRPASTARASDGAAVGELPPAYGPGNGSVQTDANRAQGQQAATAAGQGTHAGHAGHGEGALANGNGGPMPGMSTLSAPLVEAIQAALLDHRVSRPVVEANARNLAVLQGVTGPQFDATYMDAQIAGHQYALTNLDRMIQAGGVSDEMMGIMRATRATVAQHLAQAQAIRGRL
jgi:predicted outer membrane protein